MLQLILGRSGCGKTYELYNDMKRVLGESEHARVYLLVPEQASFENERQLLLQFGPKLSQRVQVLSFTRMADTVLREIGGVAGKRMDTTVSLLLMSQALSAVTDQLHIFRRHCENTAYLEPFLTLFGECKKSGISTKTLSETAAAFPKGVLRSKTEELALIFGAYEALVASAELIDPLDDLTVLSTRLSESRLFDNAYVFVDGFDGFTGQEFSVLEQLLPRVSRMTVTLCTDRTAPSEDAASARFFSADRTANRLREAAFSRSVPVGKIRHLTHNHRTDDTALQLLEEGIFTPSPAVCSDPTDSVCVTACNDMAEECRYAARTIRRLLRENGGHCRNFTVVTRQLNAYAGLLQSAFEREGLPYHIDQRESILTQPLVTLVESALAVITNGWDSADVLRLCKTGLIGFSAQSVSQLENYVFVWGIRGKGWKLPFENHPDGFDRKMDEKVQKRLQYLNILRRRIVEPLNRLQTRLSGNCNGKTVSLAIWQFLTELRVPRMIRLQAARLIACGEPALAEHQGRMWDHVVSLLDTFAAALQGSSLSVARFAQLFHLAVASADLGVIPQTLDGVRIGSADHIRYTNPETVIVLGANEGVFPAYPASGGMLTDKERRRLIDAGLPMLNDLDMQTAQERYYAYAAVSAPTKRLLVTYVKHNGKDPQYPSALIADIDRIVPHHAVGVATDPQAGDTESSADAFSRMADLWWENSVPAASLRKVFENEPAFASRLAAGQRCADRYAIHDTALAKQLFGTKMQLSPTQVDRYHSCRFAYFCQYGIRLKPRIAAKMNSAAAGTLSHYVMQELLPQYAERQWENCNKETVAADTERVVAQYVSEYMAGAENDQFRELVRQVTRLSTELLWRVVKELKQSRFVPIDFELPIGRCDTDNSGIPPWILTAPDGTTVQVSGKVDRVDVLEKDGKSYIRIVDYKTGKKLFDLSEIVEGLNLQMLIYLFSISKNGTARYGEVVPAGVLYLPAKLPVVSIERNAPQDIVEESQLKTMCMNGLLLDDPEILKAMDADLAGMFIPAKQNKDGSLSKTSSLASLRQFGMLQRKIENLLLKMAKTLHQGDIAADPLNGAFDTCRYCEYHDICGHETTDPLREITKRDLETVLHDLENEFPETQKEEPDHE